MYFGKNGSNAVLSYSSSYPNYGIWYHDENVDKMAFSASNNANVVANADLCINGNGDGTVTIRGNTIYHTGNLSTKNMSINGTNYALYTSANSLPTIYAPTAFGTAGQVLATNSTTNGLTWVDANAHTHNYLVPETYTPTDNTVGGHKAGLVNWMKNDTTYGIGKYVIVGASFISQWNDDSAKVDPSSVYAMIKIGGGYYGSTYGQWLLSGYSTNRIWVIGRNNNTWNSSIQ